MKKVNVVCKLIGGVVALSAAAAGVAFVADQISQKKNPTEHVMKGPYEKYVKRPLDCFLSTGAFIALSPILGITALLVRTKLGSSVLFSQDRPGKNGKIFRLYKFRSMTDERDENGELLADDIRLTKFGRLLRSTSLDELPELINIIKGDMSVIGPRPLLKEYLPYYTDEEQHRHDVRPGLTGLAQVNGRNAIGSWEERFAYDLQYVKNVNLKMDLHVLIQTVAKVVKRSDIQVGSEIKVGRLDNARKQQSDYNLAEETVE
jgi:lipopolysaccharide/colanic/teichoic acid biosynthesis glycosyltransferase